MPRTQNKQFNNNTNKSIITPITSPVIIKNNNSLFSSIKEGFGFGIGSTIARNMFGSSSVHPISISKVSCVEYNKCLESNDKYECFGNLDQREYVECRIANKSQ